MNVLSLFDGISCGQQALKELGIKVDNYFASEIKDIALKVTMENHPNTIQLGDVTKIQYFKSTDILAYGDKQIAVWDGIDLLIGGSPCQDLSSANKVRDGLKGSKSMLFLEYVRLLKEVKPKYFLLENVARMKKEDKDIISKELGVEPIRINSSLLSPQLRDRLYWTNIPNVTQPEDAGGGLQEILTSGTTDRKKARALLVSDSRPLKTPEKMLHRYYNTGFTTLVFEGEELRYLNQTELERCQTLPDGYTKCLTRNQAANVLGDCWTVSVIKHIFKNLPVDNF